MLTALALASLALVPGHARLVEDDAPVLQKSERSARLLADRSELEASRPPILFPVLLTSAGIVVALGGVAFVWAGLVTAIYYAFSFAVGSVVLLSVGLVLFAAGIPITAIGAVKLHRARKERRKVDQRLEQLEHEEAGMQTLLTF
jgi:hypothetical protein